MKLSYISKYRTHIMGAAMMWIMWFHSAFTGKSEVFHFIHNIGFYGVDMFLLVSGLGLYFSMRKSKSAGEFYKKRALRILPAYLIISVSWYLFFKTEVSFGDSLLSVLGINYFRGTIYGRPEYFDWFLPTLAVFYLITPLYDKLFQKFRMKWLFTLISMAISPLLCYIAFRMGRQVLFGTLVRIAVFFLGYWVGWFLYEKKDEIKHSWAIYVPMLIAGIGLGYYIQTYVKNPTVFWGLNCYPALLAAPAVCAVLSFIFEYLERFLKYVGGYLKAEKAFVIVGKVLLFPFYVCGRYSLEIYLFHQRLMEFVSSDKNAALRDKLFAQNGIVIYSGRYYFIMALLSIVFAAALHEIISLLSKHINGMGLAVGLIVLVNTFIILGCLPLFGNPAPGVPRLTFGERTGVPAVLIGFVLGIAAAILTTLLMKKKKKTMDESKAVTA